MQRTLVQEVTKGITIENPVFRLLLGLCPSLAVTTSLINGLGMGVAATFVLICSNGMLSLIRGIIPPKIRIPIYIIVIATFVSIMEMMMEVYTPALHKALGIFVPLIAVNCIIFARAEIFAGKNGVGRSMLDGLGAGLGFTLSLAILAGIREILGDGKLLGYPVMGQSYEPILLMILPAGGFFILGFLVAALKLYDLRAEAKKSVLLASNP
ncbi:MAG: electron transport complex subunit RsxE [Syntrophobacterales bacterium]|jgi:electron transport complex protein RnfE|nr:electron transport complex subunit RsxE [Syntrophobacterales bacterium]